MIGIILTILAIHLTGVFATIGLLSGINFVEKTNEDKWITGSAALLLGWYSFGGIIGDALANIAEATDTKLV